MVDEIGAQGGETSLFPSHPRNPPSKRFLSQIVRQGRSFGVTALLGTQNPTHIDYKAQQLRPMVGKSPKEQQG